MTTVIDGQILEGGGQILRNSIALSCLLKKPITVNNIRGKRSKPGLRPQHLTGTRLVCELCCGTLSGDDVGSTSVTLKPLSTQAGNYSADTQTAGSVCLLIQVALPCLVFAPGTSVLLLKGGTNAEMAPPIEFFTEILTPILEKFGINITCNIIRRGFFPKGNGEVELTVNPVKQLSAINLTEFGRLGSIRGTSFVAGALPIKVAKIMTREATRVLREVFPSVPIQLNSHQFAARDAFGTGCGIMIIAETTTGCLLSGSALGKKGLPAEQVGALAAEILLRNLQQQACVDEHLQDQLIIFMALATGKSAIKTGPVTLHTQTAIHIAELLTEAKFTVTKTQEANSKFESCLIECTGIGLQG
eukprot:gene7830-8680_t